MKNLVLSGQIERLLLFYAVTGPLIGVVVGTLLGAHEKKPLRKILSAFLTGCLGIVVYVLWKVYNIMVKLLGLDSFLNLAIQIVLFAVIGALVGVLINKWRSFNVG